MFHYQIASLNIILRPLHDSNVAILSCSLSAADGPCLQDLMTAILDIMGLKPSDVSDSDTLASMGIDSMQLVEVGDPPPPPFLSPHHTHTHSYTGVKGPAPDTASRI